MLPEVLYKVGKIMKIAPPNFQGQEFIANLNSMVSLIQGVSFLGRVLPGGCFDMA